MPQFIPLSTFKDLYSQADQLFEVARLEDFITKLKGDEGRAVCAEKGIDESNLYEFIRTIGNPENVLYYSWVEQNKALLNLLTKNEVVSFEDNAGILKHRFAPLFQKFVSPYLADVLLRFPENEKDENRAKAFSYVRLLDDDHRSVVEAQIYKPIQKRLDQLKAESKSGKSEIELSTLVKPLCSDEIISCNNSLSKAQYAVKLNYVDSILAVIKTNACSVRLANWILKRMEEVELNKEHEDKINELRRELASGTWTVKNPTSGKLPSTIRKVPLYLFLFFLGFAAFYIIYYKPFGELNSNELSEETSFKKFTIDERKEIDSLIRILEERSNPKESIDDDLSQNYVAPVKNREPFTNQLLEKIYQDLLKDAALKEKYTFANCGTQSTGFVLRKQIKEIQESKGNVALTIQNSSDFDVIVYASADKSSATVYSCLLKKGETIKFNITKDNVLFAIAGNNFKTFTKPAGAMGNELPSGDYTHHFCDTDFNFETSVRQHYRITSSSGKAKLRLNGMRNMSFEVEDFNGAMETL